MKKGFEEINWLIKLVIIIALIIIAFMVIKNIDVIKEGFDKFLSSIILGSTGLKEKQKELFKSGEEYTPFEQQKLESDTRFKKLSLEECQEGLEKRKKEYDIPNKLCYWEIISKVYDEKCENLDESKIKRIFEEKAIYREKSNPDWAKLNTDFEFCVAVEYDCEGWLKRGYGMDTGTLGNYYSPGLMDFNKKPLISVNPFYIMNKNFVQNIILIHEGLHSIQDRNAVSKKILPYIDLRDFSNSFTVPLSSEVTTYNSLFGLENSPYKEYKEVYYLHAKIGEKYKELIILINKKLTEYEEYSGRTKKFNEWKNLYSILKKQENPDYTELDKISKEYDTIDKERKEFSEEIFLKINFNYLILPDKTFAIEESNKFYKYLIKDDSFSSELKNYLGLIEKFKSSDSEGYKNIIMAYDYTAKFDEIDPRLSEVNRWWLDKTAPNCEIITTPKRAKEVLKAFLAEKGIAEEYALTQRQLQVVMDIAKKIEREEEIYNKLANRIPGLAMDDSKDDGTALA